MIAEKKGKETRRKNMKEKNLGKGKKQILLASFGILIILLASSVFASNYKNLCLNKGEKIAYSKCNSNIKDFTCDKDHCINNCVNLVVSGAYCPTGPNNCNGMACSTIGENTSIDTQPPIITLINPVQNAIYNKGKILFNVGLNEVSNLYYTDLINGKGKWTTVCQKCSSYSNERSFSEGLNSLQIKAVDAFGNTAYKNVSFFLDSKKPQIHQTEPKKGFASGEFSVQYTEDNLAEVRIDYGNTGTGMRSAVLSGCLSGKKQECGINLDLKDYDGNGIVYWFSVKDIAGNNVSSKNIKLTADTTFPVINNPSTFWKQGIGKDNKNIYVTLNITEKNFDSVEYQDALDPKLTWKSLCSSLKKGICDKKITLKLGTHKLNFQITDKAGNAVPAETTQFVVA